jgi:thiazole synthase ThiGH ThiG subunit
VAGVADIVIADAIEDIGVSALILPWEAMVGSKEPSAAKAPEGTILRAMLC